MHSGSPSLSKPYNLLSDSENGVITPSRCWLVLLLLFTHLFVSELFCQTPVETNDLNFKTKPLGLITAITSDQDGYVWISTNYGIYRYDGTDYVPMEEIFDDPPKIKSEVHTLYVDRYNQFWIYRRDLGLYRIDLNHSVWQYYPSFKEDISSSFYYSFFEDDKNNLFIPYKNGLAIYQRNSDTFDIVEIDPNQKNTRLITGQYQNKIILSIGVRIFTYDTVSGETEEITTLNKSTLISDIELDPYGYLWVSYWDPNNRGLLRYDFKTDSIIEIFRMTGPASEATGNSNVWQMLSTGESMYFVTNTHGLWRFDYQKRKLTKIGIQVNYEEHPVNQFRAIHRDKFGRLWLGNSVEIFRELIYHKQIKQISNTSTRTRLPSNHIFTVTTLSNHELAIGTDHGLALYNPISGDVREKKLPLYHDNPYNNQVRHILEDGSDMWIMTWSGLLRINIQTLQVKEQYFTRNRKRTDGPMVIDQVGAINRSAIDDEGNLWVINTDHELIKIFGTPEHRLVKKYDLRHDTIGEYCYVLKNHPKWGLMVCTDWSLWQYNSGSDDFSHSASWTAQEPIRRYQLDIATGGDSSLYVLLNDSLYTVEEDSHSFQLRKIGYPTGYHHLNHLIVQDDAIAWMTEKSGLLRWDFRNNKILHLDNEIHLFGSSFARNPELNITDLTNKGLLSIASNQGVLQIDLSKFQLNPSPPQIVITSLLINDKNHIPTPTHLPKEIILPHDQNNIQVSYSILNDEVPIARRYRYRINNNHWIPVDNQSTITLSGLAPGHYMFELTARSSDDVPALYTRKITFKIRSPWYATNIAYLFYLLFLGLLSYWFYRFRLSSILAKKEAARIKELDQFKNQFFTNITHELRTPLTVITGMANKIESEPPQWSERGARLIKRNSETLLKLINGILDLSKLEQGMTEQKLIQGDIIAYLGYLTGSFRSNAEIQNHHLRFESNYNQFLMDFDKDTVRGIMSNLISNAIKYSNKPGEIIVRVHIDESQARLKIEVIDQGIGISLEDQRLIFDRYYQVKDKAISAVGTGIGLSLTRELVSLAGGTISVRSQPGLGSTFQILLPITHTAESETLTPPSEAMTETEKEEIMASDEKKTTILIVEDNPDVSEYIRSCLDMHYHCHWAPNGKAGLEKAVFLMPDLIISDIMMPVMDGLEAARYIRQMERSDAKKIPI
ncbi:MAG: response regulator, partial [Saprospiraceae bacterium]|nr:response regulator [Saprospiraceae bacterium]